MKWGFKMFLFRIPGALLNLLHCVLLTAGGEVVRLQELEGNTVTINTGFTGVQSDAHILWFYRSEKLDIKIVNSQVFRGEIITDYYRERFRDRLQLDRSSGSLTIRNISREDSGFYTLQIITESTSAWRFSVKVYAPVSKPVIRTQTKRRSSLPMESCSHECSVENGEDVSLFWYKEKERISSISTADSNDSSLHLPLNRTFITKHTYTCVSANPVTNQTTQLNITQLCHFNTGNSQDDGVPLRATVLIPVGLFVAAVIFILLLWLQKTRRNLPVSEEVSYAEVKTLHHKQSEGLAESSEKENCTRVQDEDKSVVYFVIIV